MTNKRRVLSRRWPATLSLEPSDVHLDIYSGGASLLVLVPENAWLTRLCQVFFGAVPLAMFFLLCLAEPGAYILACFGVLTFAGAAELCCDRSISIEATTKTIRLTKYYFLFIPVSHSFHGVTPSKILISSGVTEFGKNKMICVRPNWLRYCIVSFQDPIGDQMKLLQELCIEIQAVLCIGVSVDVDD
ncbi:hypothetical protein [Rhodopirellula europaea]|uniref:hypothetical protein n=1 Tax=Rhodopirellula europaea TaxID=1263866 RepID=UPI003D2A3CBC